MPQHKLELIDGSEENGGDATAALDPLRAGMQRRCAMSDPLLSAAAASSPAVHQLPSSEDGGVSTRSHELATDAFAPTYCKAIMEALKPVATTTMLHRANPLR